MVPKEDGLIFVYIEMTVDALKSCLEPVFNCCRTQALKSSSPAFVPSQMISLDADEPVHAVQGVTLYNVASGTFTLRYSTVQ